MSQRMSLLSGFASGQTPSIALLQDQMDAETSRFKAAMGSLNMLVLLYYSILTSNTSCSQEETSFMARFILRELRTWVRFVTPDAEALSKLREMSTSAADMAVRSLATEVVNNHEEAMSLPNP